MTNHRLRGFFVWLWPLLATAGTCYAVFAVYRHHDFSRQDDDRIAVAIAIGYFFAAAAVAIFTRRWTLRGLGQLTTYLCDGIFYVSLGTDGFTRERLSMLRAGFSVGVTALVVGLVWWAVRTRGGRREPPPLFRRKVKTPVPDDPLTDQLVSLQIAGTPVPTADA